MKLEAGVGEGVVGGLGVEHEARLVGDDADLVGLVGADDGDADLARSCRCPVLLLRTNHFGDLKVAATEPLELHFLQSGATSSWLVRSCTYSAVTPGASFAQHQALGRHFDEGEVGDYLGDAGLAGQRVIAFVEDLRLAVACRRAPSAR